MLESSIDRIAVVLGILKAGAAVVPLDVNDPVQRTMLIVEDVRSKLVIASRSTSAKVAGQLGNVKLCLLEDLMRSEAPRFDERVSPDNIAYILYTSGSTGEYAIRYPYNLH